MSKKRSITEDAVMASPVQELLNKYGQKPVTPASYTYRGQVIKQPSKTIPDQTMSIKTLLQRYAQGITTAMGKTPIYEEEGSELVPPNWATMDLSERADYMAEKAKEIKDIRDKYEKEIKQAELDKLRKQFRQEYDDEKAKETEQAPGKPGATDPKG